jgi:hypothetical protein
MINLEELKLYLLIKIFDSNYIDGIQLYDQLLFHITKLNKFTFSIQTVVYRDVRPKLIFHQMKIFNAVSLIGTCRLC